MLEFFLDKKSYMKFGSWTGPIPQVGDIVLLGESDSFFRVIQRVIDQSDVIVNGNVYLFINEAHNPLL